MRLENWYIGYSSKSMNPHIIGDIYDDRDGRWPDGHTVTTSRLMYFKDIREGSDVETMNSTYTLGKPKDMDEGAGV